MNFYSGLFDRLTKDVPHTGDVTRYVAFESHVSGNDYLHFFGIEVEQIAEIPEGMTAWSLERDTRTVWARRGGRDVVLSRDDINWQWVAPSPSEGGRYTGEFTGPFPSKRQSVRFGSPRSLDL